MSPEEVRMIVNEILPQLDTTPWGTYVVAGVISLLTAGGGAFLGSYLKKQGENKANDAHFETLSKQLNQNTKDTEWIKTSLSGSNWVSQQQWISKEKYYTSLATHVSNWSNAIVAEMTLFGNATPEQELEWENDGSLDEIRAKAMFASNSINELQGPTLIFLSVKTEEALKNIFSTTSELSQLDIVSSRRLPYINDSLTTALKIILNEAKLDLNKPLLTIDSTTITR